MFYIGMDAEQGEKPPTKKKGRVITRKSMVIKKWSRRIKSMIKYNLMVFILDKFLCISLVI